MATEKIIKINAEGKILGRLASEIAGLLQDKNSPAYRPNKLTNNLVEVANAGKIVLSGKKIETKEYKHFSGYPGGLKRVKTKEILAKNPNRVLYLAIERMLPKNRLRKEMLKRLKFV
ncbi:MAG: 50S ribosomal protein L13 [bacterium]|nr:50S ribosomal protein L13 [bacterium]